MKKALVIGIDNVPGARLSSAISDAKAVGDMLKMNSDGSPNFVVKFHNDLNISDFRKLLFQLFSKQCEVALFYFAGHGYIDRIGNSYLFAIDGKPFNPGILMQEVIMQANNSRASRRIIILDCCYAGAAIESRSFIQPNITINQGVELLLASREYEEAIEQNGRGVFTRLLLEALDGGASDMLGRINTASIYNYIENVLGPWEQKPIFKSYVAGFSILRITEPIIGLDKIRNIKDKFTDADESIIFESDIDSGIAGDTNSRSILDKGELELLKGAKLIVEEDITENDANCKQQPKYKLTRLGIFLWRLSHESRI